MCHRGLGCDEIAAAGEAGVSFDERLCAGSAVVGGRADLEGERLIRVVEDEVDLVLAVASDRSVAATRFSRSAPSSTGLSSGARPRCSAAFRIAPSTKYSFRPRF
jgi:hypothetical protein